MTDYSELGTGLCPVCGEEVFIVDEARDGRLVGSCGDAFPRSRWQHVDDWWCRGCGHGPMSDADDLCPVCGRLTEEDGLD